MSHISLFWPNYGPLWHVHMDFMYGVCPGVFNTCIYMIMSSNRNTIRVTGHFVRGSHHSAVDSPHNGQWWGALMFSTMYAWTNSWASDQDVCDLRNHGTHFDISVMTWCHKNYSHLVFFIMTSSNGNIFHVTGPLCGEFTGDQWIPCMRSSDVSFDLRLKKHVSKPSWGWSFETPLHSLWHHCDIWCVLFKGLITVGRELRQQHPSDLLSGAGTSRERSSRDVPAGLQITRVLLP